MSHDAIPHDQGCGEITGFTPPRKNSGRGRTNTVGRGVSVYYDRQPPSKWTGRAHNQVQILLALDPVDAVLRWESQGDKQCHGVVGQFVWILPAGTPHTAVWHGEAALVILLVDPAFIRTVCEMEITTARLAELSTLARLNLRVGHLVADFWHLCRREDGRASPLVASMGTLLATHVLRYFANSAGETPVGLPGDRLREVMDYFDAHLREAVTRASLARIARMSVRSFGRQFKIRTGFAPRDYLRRRRTMRALELMADGRLKKAAIAAEVGFYDQSHLRRQIRRFHAEEAANTSSTPPARWRGK